jgi:hypothetical protein
VVAIGTSEARIEMALEATAEVATVMEIATVMEAAMLIAMEIGCESARRPQHYGRRKQ